MKLLAIAALSIGALPFLNASAVQAGGHVSVGVRYSDRGGSGHGGYDRGYGRGAYGRGLEYDRGYRDYNRSSFSLSLGFGSGGYGGFGYRNSYRSYDDCGPTYYRSYYAPPVVYERVYAPVYQPVYVAPPVVYSGPAANYYYDSGCSAPSNYYYSTETRYYYGR